jgi:hypothetical protein
MLVAILPAAALGFISALITLMSHSLSVAIVAYFLGICVGLFMTIGLACWAKITDEV